MESLRHETTGLWTENEELKLAGPPVENQEVSSAGPLNWNQELKFVFNSELEPEVCQTTHWEPGAEVGQTESLGPWAVEKHYVGGSHTSLSMEDFTAGTD